MSGAGPGTSKVPTGLDKAAASPAIASSSTKVTGQDEGFVLPAAGTSVDLESAQAAGVIDKEIFGQLLEMDEGGDDHSFSKPLVEEYIEQADLTLRQITTALGSGEPAAKLLETLSGRGHFLKGSSAALGLVKVKESCEKMQNLGKRKDEQGGDLAESVALEQCEALLPQLKREQAEATWYLTRLIGADASPSA